MPSESHSGTDSVLKHATTNYCLGPSPTPSFRLFCEYLGYVKQLASALISCLPYILDRISIESLNDIGDQVTVDTCDPRLLHSLWCYGISGVRKSTIWTGYSDLRRFGTSLCELVSSISTDKSKRDPQIVVSSGTFTGPGNCNLSVSNRSAIIEAVTGSVIVSCYRTSWIYLQNSTLYIGGSITVTQCATAITASAASSLVVRGVSFVSNTPSVTASAGISGGAAIVVLTSSTLTLSDSVFVGNSVNAIGACVGGSACTVAGGAVYADASSTLPLVVNCTFTGNTVASARAPLLSMAVLLPR